MNDEQLIEFKTLMESLKGRSSATIPELQRLFFFNNLQFPDLNEHGIHCDSCTSRVYNRMQKFLDTL